MSEEIQDIFISEFDDFKFTGFEQFDNRMDAYILAEDFTQKERASVTDFLKGYPEECSLDSEEKIEDQNWNENWEKTIKPVRVDPFFITPTWSDEYQKLKDIIPIFIDPKMAFGTGYHETTRLIMRLLPSVVVEGQRVLDVGTGTGILAIGALKLGAKSAVGVDIDEWSYDNAIENAERNKVSEKLIIRSGSLEAIPEKEQKPFDLVLANINRNALMQIAGELVAQVESGGTLVLSGLLYEDEPGILEHDVYKNLVFQQKMQENDWIALVFKKP